MKETEKDKVKKQKRSTMRKCGMSKSIIHQDFNSLDKRQTNPTANSYQDSDLGSKLSVWSFKSLQDDMRMDMM